MEIGYRLRQIREWRNLSQGDIEKRTGLLRCYISRVENGHTVPSIETLEKIARALEVATYQLFVDLEPQVAPKPSKANEDLDWASRGKARSLFQKLRRAVSRLSATDRDLVLFVARKMENTKRKRGSR